MPIVKQAMSSSPVVPKEHHCWSIKLHKGGGGSDPNNFIPLDWTIQMESRIEYNALVHDPPCTVSKEALDDFKCCHR